MLATATDLILLLFLQYVAMSPCFLFLGETLSDSRGTRYFVPLHLLQVSIVPPSLGTPPLPHVKANK